MTTKTKKDAALIAAIKEKGTKGCAYCYGLGLDADLWGAGYRWPTRKDHAAMSARVNCDRCGKGGTEHGEAAADRSRHRLAAAKAKEGRR